MAMVGLDGRQRAIVPAVVPATIPEHRRERRAVLELVLPLGVEDRRHARPPFRRRGPAGDSRAAATHARAQSRSDMVQLYDETHPRLNR